MFKVEVNENVPEGHMYFLFDKPVTGINIDVSHLQHRAIFTVLDYEEEEEQEPTTIEFSL